MLIETLTAILIYCQSIKDPGDTRRDVKMCISLTELKTNTNKEKRFEYLDAKTKENVLSNYLALRALEADALNEAILDD